MDSVIAPCAQDAIAVHAVATMLDLAAGMTATAHAPASQACSLQVMQNLRGRGKGMASLIRINLVLQTKLNPHAHLSPNCSLIRSQNACLAY